MEAQGKVLNDYMTFRAIDCKNTDAISNYRRYIGRFLNTKEINEKYLTSYINKLSNDFSQTTLNVIKPLLKNFIKWQFPDYSLKFRNLDKLCKTKRAKNTYSADDMLSMEEFKKIMKEEKDLFWKVFWAVYFYGGFRPIDCIRLKKEMFNFEDDGMIIIKTFIGKNQKEFYKSLPKELTPLIEKWFSINPSDWVFASPEGDKPIHEKTPHKRLERISLKALGKKVNPYILRHSFATIKYNEDGLSDDIVADQLGHNKSMKDTYFNLDDTQKKARAKKVWTNKKEMPKEEKDKMQKQIDFLTSKIEVMTSVQTDFRKSMIKRNDKIMKDFMRDFKKENSTK